MSPLDSGFPHDSAAKKRTLPSVTEVVRELAKVVSADPAVLFKAARSVVGGELAKVKQGFEAAPLDVLVRRARLQLEREGEATPVSDPAPPPMPVFPARRPVSREAPKASPTGSPPAPDDPFENASSRAELGWEKEILIQPDDAPFRSAIIPIPYKARGPAEISAAIDAPPQAAPEPKSEPAPATKPQPELELEFAPPPPAPAAPEPRTPEIGPAPPVPEEPMSEEPMSEEPMPRPAVASAPAIPLVKSMPDMPPPHEVLEERDSAGPAMEEFNFKAAERPAPAPARSSRRAWLAALAGVLAVGAALTWAVREGVFKNEIVRKAAPVAQKNPDVEAPAGAESVSAPAAAPPAAAKPAAPPQKAAPVPAKPAEAGPPSGVAVPKGRAAVLLTPDWAGKPVVYVLHFSSMKDRESAAKEALKLGAAFGAPGHAVEVDLGEKGIWYRVVIGEFADVDAARAFRADLEAKKTPGMGFVYEMRGR